jgi:hypothetical protein
VAYDLTYIALKQAFAEQGCPLCRLREHSGRQYLSWLLHERVNDMATRLKLAQSWGFCGDHAWQLQELEWERCQDGMGTAILWEWLIERYRTILRQPCDNPLRPKKRLRRRRKLHGLGIAPHLLQSLTAQGPCPACEGQRQSEQYALSVFSQHLAEEESFRLLYKQSMGLCVPHFKAALEAAQDEQALRLLVEVQLETLTRLRGELSDCLRKYDPQFAREPHTSKADVFMQATELLVGRKPRTDGRG